MAVHTSQGHIKTALASICARPGSIRERTSAPESLHSGQPWQNNESKEKVIYIYLSAVASQQENRACEKIAAQKAPKIKPKIFPDHKPPTLNLDNHSIQQLEFRQFHLGYKNGSSKVTKNNLWGTKQ